MAILLDSPLSPDEGTLIVRNIPTPTTRPRSTRSFRTCTTTHSSSTSPC
jgi:hypothetical protein